MPVTDKDRKDYLNQVDKLLVCSRKERRRIIKDLNSEIDELLDDKPLIDPRRLEWEMGAPQEVADNYTKSLPFDTVRKNCSPYGMIKAIAIAVFVLILLYVGFRLYSIELRKEHSSHIEREIVTETIDGVETTRVEYKSVKDDLQ